MFGHWNTHFRKLVRLRIFQHIHRYIKKTLMDSSEPHLGKVLLWLFYNTNQQRDVSRASLWNWMFLIPLNTRLYKPKTKSLEKPYKPKTQYLYNDKEDNTGLKPDYPISQPIGWKIIFILHYQILLWKCLHNQIKY